MARLKLSVGTAGFGGFEDDFEKTARLWGLRLMLRLNLHPSAMRSMRHFLAPLLGTLEDNLPAPEGIPRALRTAVTKLVRTAPQRPDPLYANVRLLGGCLGLGGADEDILAFFAAVERFEMVADLFRDLGNLSDDRLCRIVATALVLDLPAVKTALAEKGRLQNSGLLKLNRNVAYYDHKVGLLPGLANSLLSPHENLESLIKFCMVRSPAPELGIDDFGTQKDLLNLLIPYLRNVRARGEKGCNILLYGAPGVGKTELTRTTVHHLGFNLYEVAALPPESCEGSERLLNYRFCQNLLAEDSKAVLLFDEVEDAFPCSQKFSPSSDRMTDSGAHKAWTNRMLELNPVPAIWIANEVSHIDPAFLRRFDIVEEVPPMARDTRLRLFSKALDGTPLLPSLIDRLADYPNLTPADAARLKKIVPSIDLSEPSRTAQQVERIVTGHLRAQGIPAKPRYPQPVEYRVDLLNADIDIGSLIESLRFTKKGRLCLYGPPGTGKTALAHHLADLLNRPILVRRASDILSMWVGGTEKAIAEMFEQAGSDNSILLLDEADSFLQNRQNAGGSWEITRVNELLTQMECFGGLFICATNLMDNLDSAVLRRFHFKIAFGYLTEAQRISCFKDVLKRFGRDLEVDESVYTELSRLGNITPGDFSTVSDRFRLLQSVPTPLQLLEQLRAESRLKPDGRRNRVGFLQNSSFACLSNPI